MNLIELFQQQGLGVMATSSKDGCVNTAVYARPHVIDEKTMVWGMTEGRTYQNIAENPSASFLFKTVVPNAAARMVAVMDGPREIPAFSRMAGLTIMM